MDSDVELIRHLEPLRGQMAFCGIEKWGNINTWGCCGAVKKHAMIKKMLEYRENIKFIYNDGSFNLETNGIYETIPFINAGLKLDGSIQRINNMTVLPSEFFHPYDYMSGRTVVTENIFSIHHFNGGRWMEKSRVS